MSHSIIDKNTNKLFKTYVFFLVFGIFRQQFCCLVFCNRQWKAYSGENKNFELQTRLLDLSNGVNAFKNIDIHHSKLFFGLLYLTIHPKMNVNGIIQAMPPKVTKNDIDDLNNTLITSDEGWATINTNMKIVQRNGGIHPDAKSFGFEKVEGPVRKCYQCGNTSKPLRRCKSCKMLYFCSRKCQKLDWQSNYVHKYYCSVVYDNNINLTH